MGTKIAATYFNRHVSGAMLRKINTKLGTTVLTYGTKRGGVALGRMLPFGVGATIGGSVNFITTRSFGHVILRYSGRSNPVARCSLCPTNTIVSGGGAGRILQVVDVRNDEDPHEPTCWALRTWPKERLAPDLRY